MLDIKKVPSDKKAILVFDVDGTLTPARRRVSSEMLSFLAKLHSMGVPLAVVGGSDLNKIIEQLADSQQHLLSMFDFSFSENGLVGFKGTDPYPSQSIQKQIGDEKLQKLINWVLGYFSNITLPVKRGNFVEFRKGMINFSPIGRSCSLEEREQFVVYDKQHNIRKTFVKALEENFGDYGLTFAIGGQISVDVYPNGWDKTFCLQYIEKEYDVIHFFGDKTEEGGNDYAIYADDRTIGHAVTDPTDTIKQVAHVVKEVFGVDVAE